MIENSLAKLASAIDRHADLDGTGATSIGPLNLIRTIEPTRPVMSICEPALCVIASGRKRVMVGEDVLVYDPAQFLLVSAALPLVGQVIAASPDEPYRSVRVDLDLVQIHELVLDVPSHEARSSRGLERGIAISRTSPGLLDALARLVGLLDTPGDIPVIAPLILRELTYRLLTSDQGPGLRQIAADGGHFRRIASSIGWLRRHFDRPLRIEDLAQVAHMSPSAFHHHFKLVTALSPLQYQKRLRLQEARRLMLVDTIDAADAGYRVGYESASQFSREYRRLFGEAPRRDIARLREDTAPR